MSRPIRQLPAGRVAADLVAGCGLSSEPAVADVKLRS